MPVVSKSQLRALEAKAPDVAKRWLAMTPNISSLPEHAAKTPAAKAARQRIRREYG